MDTRFYCILHCTFNFSRYEVSPRASISLNAAPLLKYFNSHLYRRSLPLLHFKLLPLYRLLSSILPRYRVVEGGSSPRWGSCTKYLKTRPLVCDSILLIAGDAMVTTLSLSLSLLNNLLIPCLPFSFPFNGFLVGIRCSFFTIILSFGRM